MTPEDLAQITTIVGAAEQRITAAAQDQMTAIVAAAEQRITAAAAAAEARAQEIARNMQTEILRGLESFARGNFARMHRLETSDADTNTRITALEETRRQ